MPLDQTKPDPVHISVIIPIRNGEKWIEDCFNGILNQTILRRNDIQLELSIFNDASNDGTEILLNDWEEQFLRCKLSYKITSNFTNTAKGVGYAKNMAVKASCGEYICFQDIDDIMLPDRISKQYDLACLRKNSIVGCKFKREPENSTERFTKWANNLTETELNTQIYTSHGPTVIMPTWFMHRQVFERVNGFSEEATGSPEDLIFFYDHIDKGGTIVGVDECLLIYRYIPTSATFSVLSETIWNVKLNHFVKNMLPQWRDGFTVWNAGKLGRMFVKSLSEDNRKFIKAMCDVDVKKIGQYYEYYCPKKRKPLCRIPIVHFKDAKPPFVICMKLDLTAGEFEKNLKLLNLTEGKDYVIFN